MKPRVTAGARSPRVPRDDAAARATVQHDRLEPLERDPVAIELDHATGRTARGVDGVAVGRLDNQRIVATVTAIEQPGHAVVSQCSEERFGLEVPDHRANDLLL